MNVVVKLQGGLGNQMFQYAFAKKISIATGRNLILDKSFLLDKNPGPWNNYICRDYDLDIFNLSNCSEVDYFDKKFLCIPEEIDYSSTSISQIDLFIDKIIKSDEENIYLDGYWASPRYFKDLFNYREEFSVRSDLVSFSPLSDEILSSNSVMINIRRTDFLNGNFHGVYGREYVLKCIKEIEKVEKNLRYYIFSDDITWCKENLSDIHDSFVVDHSNKGEKFSSYLYLMTLCKHFIIPNSTFAWWAAFLSGNKNKKVFYPKIWLKGPNVETNLLVKDLDWKGI